MVSIESSWILEAVQHWLRAPSDPIHCDKGLNPHRLGNLLEQNRLLPLFQTLPLQIPDGRDWERFRDRLDNAYQRSLLQGLQQLKFGQDVMACLSSAGIKSLAVRGPFLAEDIYGDPSVRLSSDVDLLVSCRDRRRAWTVCQAAGYHSLDWECPLWPVDRHRIHWRIGREGDPVVCELHWAVEPAYGVMTLDYEALLRDDTPAQRLLLLCIHAAEHASEAQANAAEGTMTADDAIRLGMIFRWLDVAMFLRKQGSKVDWGWIDQHSYDRRVATALALCLNGVRDWFGLPLPEEAAGYLPGWAAAAKQQASTGLRHRLEQIWERYVRRKIGMETPMADVLYYLWPHREFFGRSCGGFLMLRRAWHSVMAGGVLVWELLSYACFAVITSVRRFARSKAAAAGGHS